MDFNREQFSNEELIYLYRNLLLPRMIEEKNVGIVASG